MHAYIYTYIVLQNVYFCTYAYWYMHVCICIYEYLLWEKMLWVSNHWYRSRFWDMTLHKIGFAHCVSMAYNIKYRIFVDWWWNWT